VVLYSDGPNTCAGTVESNWTVPHFGCLSFGGSSFILSCNAQGAYVAKYVVPDCPFTGPYASPSTTSYSLGCTLGSTQVTGLSSYAACTNATGELVEVTTYSSGSCNGTSGNGTESSAVTLLSGMCNAYGGSGFQVNVTGLLITYAVYDNVLCQGDPLKYTAVLAPAARTQYGLLHTGSEGCANTFAVANGSMIEGAVDFFVVGYSGAQSSMASAVVIIGALITNVVVLCA